MAQMKLIPADSMKDELWGKRGTPEREAMERQLQEDINNASSFVEITLINISDGSTTSEWIV